MGLKDDMDADIVTFFDQTEKQTMNDKSKTLKLLLNKYIHLSTADHVLDYHDLMAIIDKAQTLYANKTIPSFIGKNRRKVMMDHERNLCMAEATIEILNNSECLKKLPKFDYREEE